MSIIDGLELDELYDELAHLRAENERLLNALKHYGDHTYECELKNGKNCNCGYEESVA